MFLSATIGCAYQIALPSQIQLGSNQLRAVETGFWAATIAGLLRETFFICCNIWRDQGCPNSTAWTSSLYESFDRYMDCSAKFPVFFLFSLSLIIVVLKQQPMHLFTTCFLIEIHHNWELVSIGHNFFRQRSRANLLKETDSDINLPRQNFKKPLIESKKNYSGTLDNGTNDHSKGRDTQYFNRRGQRLEILCMWAVVFTLRF